MSRPLKRSPRSLRTSEAPSTVPAVEVVAGVILALQPQDWRKPLAVPPKVLKTSARNRPKQVSISRMRLNRLRDSALAWRLIGRLTLCRKAKAAITSNERAQLFREPLWVRRRVKRSATLRLWALKPKTLPRSPARRQDMRERPQSRKKPKRTN